MANNRNLKPFQQGFDPRRGKKPKGVKHLATLIQEMSNDPKFRAYMQDPKQGYIEYKGPAIQAIVSVALQKAVAGDKDAREWIAKHGWAKQELDPLKIDPNPIQFINVVPISSPGDDQG